MTPKIEYSPVRTAQKTQLPRFLQLFYNVSIEACSIENTASNSYTNVVCYAAIT
jgi:hypothetical protein